MHVIYLEVVFLLCMHHFDFTHSLFGGVCVCVKLQALVYGIHPPTTTIANYTIGFKRLMDSFSSVLRWQQVCNRQFKLHQAFLS